MTWPHYFACFFAGVFLANAAPHFVKGISGDRFPSPFAKPPGKGLSSSLVNVLWGLFNLIVGYLLFRFGRVSAEDDLTLLLFFAGVVIISTLMSVHFARKHSHYPRGESRNGLAIGGICALRFGVCLHCERK